MSTTSIIIIMLLIASNSMFIALFIKYKELSVHYKSRYEDLISLETPKLIDIPILNTSSLSKIEQIKFERRYQKDLFDALGVSDPKSYILNEMRYGFLEAISDFLVFKETYDVLNDEYCFYGYLEVVDNNADNN